MASCAEMCPCLESDAKQPVKAYLLRSQNLLVEALYNLEPLLDCILAAGLLSLDNYYDVKAKGTPPKSARKLLEIVQGEMDEIRATGFLECLRKCKQHYPRLHTWLNTESGISRGPTEQQLQAQFSCLCSRLGSSVLPVSLALFSSSNITQFELERIQAATTPTQQSQTLLSICLNKGETACRSFYTALYNEDQLLAKDLNVTSLMEGLLLNCDEVGSLPLALEEIRTTATEDQPHSALLQEVSARISVSAGLGAKLNVCMLGVAIGLPRRTVRECLLDGVSINDSAQLEALVNLFMKKTKDAERLLGRVSELKIPRMRLSKRGCLLLQLLQEAESLIPTHQLHIDACGEQCTLCTIFRFLLWDCLAQAVEKPDLPPRSSPAGMIKTLQECTIVELDLLQELNQCWTEGGTENLLQCVRVLSQILRDLHPFEDHIDVSPPIQGFYSCHPGRLHRVTGFWGVSDRVLRKTLSGTSPGRSYREVCLGVAQLINLVYSEKHCDLRNAQLAQIVHHIRLILTQPAFSSQKFDAGVRERLLCLLEFNPEKLGVGPVMQLHQETLSDLRLYLQTNDHHNFQFVLESVKMLERARLISVNSTGVLVAIDDGMEQVFSFRTSIPGSFLVCLHCVCYEEGNGCLKVYKPHCILATEVSPEALGMIESLGHVLAQEGDQTWIREEKGLVELCETVHNYSVRIQDFGCCFKVKAFESECEVKFIYRDGRLWAAPQRACEVL